MSCAVWRLPTLQGLAVLAPMIPAAALSLTVFVPDCHYIRNCVLVRLQRAKFTFQWTRDVQPVCLHHTQWRKPTGQLVCSFHSATCAHFLVHHLAWPLTPTILWALCFGCWCTRGASGWMPYSSLLFQPVVSGVVSSVYAWYYIGKYRLLKLYH